MEGIPHSKKLWWIRTVGSLAETTLVNRNPFACNGNVMEIVKIDEKTWCNAVIPQSFFITNVFYCTAIGLGKLVLKSMAGLLG